MGIVCSKSCAAKLRERRKPGYDPKRVERNNLRRLLWNDCSCSDDYKYDEEQSVLDELDGCQWTDLDIGCHD